MRNQTYQTLGALLLILNKARHAVRGYRRPRPFSLDDVERAVGYDLAVCERWVSALRTLNGRGVEGARVLELGPGADLGSGLILLAQGAAEYQAFDALALARRAPRAFYDALLDRLPDESLRRDVDLLFAGQSERLRYTVDTAFDLTRLTGRTFELVVSHAAFEHFDDPRRVIAQLSPLVAPGGALVAEIDLQTHTRWIREADPLNIYRYSDRLYDALRFSGSPNRVRPHEYETALVRHGWSEVRLLPLVTLDPDRLRRVRPTLNPRFRDPAQQMEILNLLIVARR